MPLVSAHAEYLKLLRSVANGQVFDLIPALRERYQERGDPRSLEAWKFNRQVSAVRAGGTLRIQATEPFRLQWTRNECPTCADTVSVPTVLGIDFMDILVKRTQRAPLRFTFYWPASDRWEGRDFAVAIESGD